MISANGTAVELLDPEKITGMVILHADKYDMDILWTRKDNGIEANYISQNRGYVYRGLHYPDLPSGQQIGLSQGLFRLPGALHNRLFPTGQLDEESLLAQDITLATIPCHCCRVVGRAAESRSDRAGGPDEREDARDPERCHGVCGDQHWRVEKGQYGH